MNQQIIYQLSLLNSFVKENLGNFEAVSTNSTQVSKNLEKINDSLLLINNNFISYQNSYVNQPWFSFIVGSLVTIMATFLYDFIKRRNDRLSKIYDHLSEQYVFHDPESLFKEAGITSTGYTQVVDGITTVITEKTMPTKMRIYLWEHTNWINYPKGYLWYLYRTYDKKLSNIKNDKNHKEIKESDEFQKVRVFFDKIKKHLLKVSGKSRGWQGE